METFISAVVSDLVSRFISSLLRRYSETQSVGEKLQRLHQLLLRVYTIVEEAQGRDITNEGMLLQLKMLMDAMYRGYYVLDMFKYRTLAEKVPGDDEVRHSLALSDIMYPCKRQCFATSTVFGCEDANELKFVLTDLERVIADVQEFVLLLESYPLIFGQPYSIYLLIDNCMFGRQLERQRIINFLLQKDSPNITRSLSVLPIIGMPRVGKKTLIEHVCHDERVINCYSSIVRLNGDDIESLILTILKVECFPVGRCLFIIEFDGDVDETAWRRFYITASSMATAGSKIIITSKTDKASSFGTAQPLTLKRLSTEEYWYFFKVLAFGSSNADDHPRLASLAMEIAAELKGSFLFANVYGRLLRANFNFQFWCSVLASWRKSRQKNLLLFYDTPSDLVAKNHPFYQHQMGRGTQVFLFCNYYSASSLCMEVPKVKAEDVITGSNIPVEEEFQVLGWRSLVPPYHCYIANCVKQKPLHEVSKKKCGRQKNMRNLQ